jgi:4-hydroxy-3-methylbut-2-en-1-yl diphosphate synthase IspG/GcpE
VSVIGCVVNGSGEARGTDIGFTGRVNGIHQVYISRLTDHCLKDADIVDRGAGREKGRGDRGREAKGKELAAAQ